MPCRCMVSHHGLVHEFEANSLTVFETNWVCVFVLDAINAPGIAFHIAGQTKLDLPSRFAVFVQRVLSLQISIGQELATIGRRRHKATALGIEGIAGTAFSHRHGTMVHAGHVRVIHSFHVGVIHSFHIRMVHAAHV